MNPTEEKKEELIKKLLELLQQSDTLDDHGEMIIGDRSHPPLFL